MKIYQMTATFGRLEHETLCLKPGLNIVEAPNEWGKSTWCAFLMAMLYGIDTRARSSKTALPDKEKYIPWSGTPMEGRIDLNWRGRDITIQRRTRGRTPLGVFQAFETATGIAVPELTGVNCGQMLLGVEQGVFRRAGFLRLQDLQVSQDEDLRRRLNALVTTGDDSGDAERLGQKLRDLRNRCRYNRTGLLPQAETTLQELLNQQSVLQTLTSQAETIRTRQRELENRLKMLKNHQVALRYADAQADASRVAAAREALDAACRLEQAQEFSCRDIPSREEAEKTIAQVRQMHQKWLDLNTESQMLPQSPQPPAVPTPFQGVPPEAVLDKAARDADRLEQLRRASHHHPVWLWILALLCLVAGVCTFVAEIPGSNILLGTAGVLLLLALIVQIASKRKRAAAAAQADALVKLYGTDKTEDFSARARAYLDVLETYRGSAATATQARGDLDQRIQELDEQAQTLTGGQELQNFLNQWEQVRDAWQACDDARRNRVRLERQFADLQAMARTAPPPEMEDLLTTTEEETIRLIADCEEKLRKLQQLLGQCQGQMLKLESAESLSRKISETRERIARLEETWEALGIAQDALTQAKAELQRRFAPKIGEQAREYLKTITSGQYDRLQFGQDFALAAGGGSETTLRPVQWRSDGTVDQLYFALRLAVADALTPEAPLILDDAMVRFDDTRLASALTLLRKEAERKQVIVFTCQGREKRLLEGAV